MPQVFGAVAQGLVDAQLALDEQGREAIDGWQDTGVPPSVFAWSRLRFSSSVSLGVEAKAAAGERTEASVAADGPATVSVSFRYLLSPQGVDEPAPVLPAPPPER